MKKKIFLALAISLLLVCLFAISVSAEVTVYDDAPATSTIVTSKDDIVVFDDGFSCPASYVVNDQTTLAFNFNWINTKASKSYTKSNIKEFDIPEGITTIGNSAFASHKGITRVSIPKTVTSIGQCMFEYATALTQCTFEHPSNSNFIRMPHYMFAGCTSLIAMSLPDCIQYISPEKADSLYNSMFSGCTSLTALYLPRGLKTLKGDSHGGAVFFNCTNLYFVEEPFTYDNIPSKPDVYRFPENLEYFKGETFKNCKNLNSVLVFGEKITDLSDTSAIPWAFNGANSSTSIVFLGDITGISVGNSAGSNYWAVSKIYFANKNDKSLDDVGFFGNSSKAVFCNADGNTTHLYKVSVDRAPTCTVDGVKGFECFCGEADPDPNNTIVDPAQGHKKDAIVGIAYNGTNKLFDAGDITYTCGICGEEHTVEGDATAIFVFRGLSAKEVEVYGKAIIQTFAVNREAMKNYNDYSDYDVVGYGLVAATELGLGGSTEIFDNDGNVNNNKAGVVNISARDENFDVFEIKVNGLDGIYTNPETSEATSLADIKVYCCGYCLVQIGDTVASYYASNGVVTETLSGATSYNELINAQ